MKKNEAFPDRSNYLTKEDVSTPRLATIASITHKVFEDEGGEKRKPVFTFQEDDLKPMVVNSTNWDLVDMIYPSDDDSDKWIGKKIEIYHDPTVMNKGKRTGGVRVRAPNQNGNGHKPQATVYTFEQAVAECEKVGLSKQELIDALKARGLAGWSATRDSAILPEIINAQLDKEALF